MMDKKDLEKFISYELHELCWRNKYPIDENIAVWSFLNALENNNFKINKKKDPFEIFYVVSCDNKHHELSAPISIKEILEGWKRTPKASLNALYDSIYLVIDRLQENIIGVFPYRKNISEEMSDILDKERNVKGKIIRESMEKEMLFYFEKYQEDVLKPSDIDYKSPFHSGILNNLIKSDIISLDRINEAIYTSYTKMGEDVLHFTNAYFSINFLKKGIIPPDDHIISEANVLDYVWAVYLLKLANLKNYEIKYTKEDFKEDDCILQRAYELGWDILEPMSLKK